MTNQPKCIYSIVLSKSQARIVKRMQLIKKIAPFGSSTKEKLKLLVLPTTHLN